MKCNTAAVIDHPLIDTVGYPENKNHCPTKTTVLLLTLTTIPTNLATNLGQTAEKRGQHKRDQQQQQQLHKIDGQNHTIAMKNHHHHHKNNQSANTEQKKKEKVKDKTHSPAHTSILLFPRHKSYTAIKSHCEGQ